MALGAAGVALLVTTADPPTAFETALTDLAESIPGALDVLWQLLAGLQLTWAVLLVVLTVVRWRPTILRDQLLAALGGGALAVAVDELWLGDTAGSLWDALVATGRACQDFCVSSGGWVG
jgi:hypothetical protein